MTTSWNKRQLARAQLAREDFVWYCQFVHQVTLAPHMKRWASYLTSDHPEHREIAIAAPPEFWKSRLLRMFLEWKIGQNVEHCMIYAMNTASQAEKQNQSIQATIAHNARYRAVFPHVEPWIERGWNRSTTFVKRKNTARPDPTLFCCGVEGPVQGSHVEWIYTDDLTDQQDVRSPKTMEAQREWVTGVLYDRLRRDDDGTPEGGWFHIQTRWAETDLWKKFTGSPEAPIEADRGFGFTPIQMPAIDPVTGAATWPEMFPLEKLDALRIAKGPQLFTMTYLCDPTALGGDVINTKRLNKYRLDAPPDYVMKVQSWDVATGLSDDAAYTVMTEHLITTQGLFLSYVWRDRLTLSRIKEQLYIFREDRNPSAILVEGKRGAGQALIDMILEDGDMSELRVIDPMGQGDKVTRAAGVAGIVEAGRYWVPESAPWLDAFVRELAAFPKGQFDDQVDSWSQALAWSRGKVRHRRRGGGVSWMRRPRPAEMAGAL